MNIEFADIDYYKNRGYGFFIEGTKGYPKKFYNKIEDCIDAAIETGLKIHKKDLHRIDTR